MCSVLKCVPKVSILGIDRYSTSNDDSKSGQAHKKPDWDTTCFKPVARLS